MFAADDSRFLTGRYEQHREEMRAAHAEEVRQKTIRVLRSSVPGTSELAVAGLESCALAPSDGFAPYVEHQNYGLVLADYKDPTKHHVHPIAVRLPGAPEKIYFVRLSHPGSWTHAGHWYIYPQWEEERHTMRGLIPPYASTAGREHLYIAGSPRWSARLGHDRRLGVDFQPRDVTTGYHRYARGFSSLVSNVGQDPRRWCGSRYPYDQYNGSKHQSPVIVGMVRPHRGTDIYGRPDPDRLWLQCWLIAGTGNPYEYDYEYAEAYFAARTWYSPLFVPDWSLAKDSNGTLIKLDSPSKRMSTLWVEPLWVDDPNWWPHRCRLPRFLWSQRDISIVFG